MNFCVSCSKNCSENDSVTCDICKKPVNVNCAGLSKNEVDCLRSKRRKIHFYCDRCDIVDTVLKLKEEVELLKKSLNETKNQVQADNVIGDRPDKFSFDDVLDEFEDRSLRSTNLIVYGLPESLSAAENDRKVDDVNICKELLVFENDDYSLNLASCYRLGKPNPNRIRPIKLCFASKEIVNKILKTYKPKNRVYLNRDLTPRQRNVNHRIRQEYHRRIEQGENGLKLKYRNGVLTIISSAPSATPKNV